MLVEHHGWEKPPAWVQLRWVTPSQVKGNTQESPLTVRHPAGGDGGEGGDGGDGGEADEKGQQT